MASISDSVEENIGVGFVEVVPVAFGGGGVGCGGGSLTKCCWSGGEAISGRIVGISEFASRRLVGFPAGDGLFIFGDIILGGACTGVGEGGGIR
jgi:hypothetical protein